MLLLKNATLFCPQPLGAVDILIGGERILWIGSSLPALPGALGVTVHDLGGLRVVPGLIDGHAHLTGGGGEAGPATRVPPPMLSQYTMGGVTSVVGVLGTDDVTRNTADLVASARALVAEGLSAWCHCGGYHLPPVTLTGTVRGDIAQVDRIIGVGEVAISDHRSSQPTCDELLRIASEAHVGGLMSGKAGVLHMHLGDGSRGLSLIREALDTSELPPRVFNPTHVNRKRALFEEAVALAHRGCTIDITAFPVEDGEDAWTAHEALERYWRAGAPTDRVTVSSDGGGCLPVFDADGRVARMDVGASTALSETMCTLLERGHALETVLPPFTCNVADFLRLPNKGRIAVGYDADVVVLDAAHRVRDVMARGAWHVRDGRLVRRGTFEAPREGVTGASARE
jgi:beta-aspartyl-dipeptidase (metallo-type)